MVLLKNDGGLLPLSIPHGGTIAVIGPNADRVMLGGYSGKPPHYVSVLQGIRDRVGDRARVVYSEGCKITVGGSWNEDQVTVPEPAADLAGIRQAVAVAEQADVVVLAIGGNEQTSREAWSRVHLGDRADLDLPGMQNELVRAVARTGKRIVALLFNGRPKSITTVVEKVPAILECWYLGQETGRAVAEVLFGDTNPSGKLPISFPRSAGHLPVHYAHKPSARRGYLFDDVSPLFPFGFGLSYTEFRIGPPHLSRSAIRAGESTTVTVEVQNVGPRTGEEVVQMYVRDRVASVTRPVKELRGFARVRLEPRAKTEVTFTIGPDELSFTDINMQLHVEPGEFDILVGASSRDQDLTRATLRVVNG
jgi:beta-glucosidase